MPRLGPGFNTPATDATNQGIGSVNLPALAAGAESTVVVNDQAVLATSKIFCQLYNQVPDATALLSITYDVKSVGAGTFTFHYKALVAMAQAWTLWYVVVN
jgi:hypothetical protein